MRSFILWGGDCKQLISGVYEDTAVLGGARAALGGYPDREGTEVARRLTPTPAWIARQASHSG